MGEDLKFFSRTLFIFSFIFTLIGGGCSADCISPRPQIELAYPFSFSFANVVGRAPGVEGGEKCGASPEPQIMLSWVEMTEGDRSMPV